MARIRSVHPGLFTDEAFVCLSEAAQIFLIGLWTEADDQGVFEWKPVTLRMRLRPNSNGPVDGLLLEMETHNVIMRYAMGGKVYGAIRNFRKYQRPKKPNEVHPVTDEVRTYVALTIQSTEPVPHQFPTSSEKSPQMEDGGDKMEEEGGKETTAGGALPISNLPDYFEPSERVFSAMGLDPDDHRMWSQRSRVGEWLKTWSLELDILPTVSRMSVGKPPGRIKTLAFFEDAIADAYATRTKPLPVGEAGNVKQASSVRASLERRLAGLGGSREVCARENDDPSGVVLEGEAT